MRFFVNLTVLFAVLVCAVLLVSVAHGAVNSVPISTSSVSPTVSGYYCNAAAPTVPVAAFIAPTLVQPASGISATSIESTDGTYFYVITLTAASGVITSLPSCPVRYTTQQ